MYLISCCARDQIRLTNLSMEVWWSAPKNQPPYTIRVEWRMSLSNNDHHVRFGYLTFPIVATREAQLVVHPCATAHETCLVGSHSQSYQVTSILFGLATQSAMSNVTCVKLLAQGDDFSNDMRE